MKFIAKLQEAVARAGAEWRAVGEDPGRLAELSAAAIAAPELGEAFREDELRAWIADGRGLPRQLAPDGAFGEPPVTLVVGEDERLIADAYFWLNAETAVHDHGFAGACRVLSGRSLHVELAFAPEGPPEADLWLGRCVPHRVGVLEPGDTFPIELGPRFCHAVWHLECPTVTLVIRSMGAVGDTAQRTYLPPTLAFRDALRHADDAVVQRRLVEHLHAREPGLALEHLARVFERSEPATIAALLFAFLFRHPPTAQVDAAVEAAQRHLGLPRAAVDAAVAHMVGAVALRPRRDWSAEAKLLAGLVVNVGFGDRLAVVLGRWLGRPAERADLERMLRELATAAPRRPRLLACIEAFLAGPALARPPDRFLAALADEYRCDRWERRLLRDWNVVSLSSWWAAAQAESRRDAEGEHAAHF